MNPLVRTLTMIALVAAVTLAAIGGATGLERLLSNPAPDPFPDPPFKPIDAGRRKSTPLWVEREAPIGFRDWQFHNDKLSVAQVGQQITDRRRAAPKERSVYDEIAEGDLARFNYTCAQYNEQWHQLAGYSLDYGAAKHASPDERDAVTAACFGLDYLHGRELAEKVLRTNPQSVPALLALATVQYHAEGNLPAALYTVRQARHILEDLGRAKPDDADSREWYLRGLALELEILNDLDRPDQALRVVEMIEKVYGPMPQWRVWPLLKLGRFDDAEKALTALEPPKPIDDDPYRPPPRDEWGMERMSDRVLLAVLHHRRRDLYEALAKHTLKSIDPQGMYLSAVSGEANFGGAGSDVAYRSALGGVGTVVAWSPYIEISACEVQAAEYPLAFSSLLSGIENRSQRMPDTLQQDQAEFDRAIATALLAVGRASDAERFARRAAENPSRNGHQLVSAPSRRLAGLMTQWAVLQSQLEQLEETKFLTAGLADRESQRAAIRSQCWTIESQVLQIVADPERSNPLRPYLPGEARFESWLLGEYLHVLPAGIATELLRQAREADTDPKAPLANGYYDALDAENAFLHGDYAAALKSADAALNGKVECALASTGERLLRARTNAIAAESACQLGKHDEYMHRLDMTLDYSPAALRLLKIAIPVAIKDDGDPLSQRIAATLARSPLLRPDPDGFVIDIKRTKDGKSIHIEMARLNDKASKERRGKEIDDGFRRGYDREKFYKIPNETDKARAGVNSAVRLTFDLSIPADENQAVADAIEQFSDHLMSAGFLVSKYGVNQLDKSPSEFKAANDLDALFPPAVPAAPAGSDKPTQPARRPRR